MRVQYLTPFQWIWLVSLSVALSAAVSGSPAWATDFNHESVADPQTTGQDRRGNGLTWTDPEPLNTSAAADSGWDHRPQVTTDRVGD